MGWVADVFEQDDGWNLLQGPPGWSICLTQSLSLSFPGVRDFLLDSFNHIAILQGGVPTTLPLLQCPKQQYHCTMRCFPRVLHPRPVPERSRHAMHMHPTQRGVCRIVRACNYVMQHRLLVAWKKPGSPPLSSFDAVSCGRNLADQERWASSARFPHLPDDADHA